jgi:uncharacterized protein YbcI
VDPRQVEEKLAERTSGTLAASVSRAVVRLMHEFTGRGPTRARAIMNANSVLVLLEDTLTRAELNLLGAGESEAVVTMRRTYFAATREQASATVAEITGRGVISMMADLDPDANMAIVFFALERGPEDGAAASTDGAPTASADGASASADGASASADGAGSDGQSA